MKKVKNRTIASVVIIIAMLVCLCIFMVKYIASGGEWATYPTNQHVFSDGVLNTGSIYDRNGVLLSTVNENGRVYSDDYYTRVSTLHAVGDPYGNMGTGALTAFREELIGYDFISGTYSLKGTGMDMYLTIDSYLNEVAYDALAGRNGTVAVYNYETGEILCMVSAPSYDPYEGFDIEDESYSGAYINKFMSSTYTPGSTYKIVTLAAAIENIPDLYERTFYCEGQYDVNGDLIICTGTHGELTIEDALADSCNCVFAQLALELGPETMNEYFDKYGLSESQEINGIKTAEGNYSIADEDSIDLAWSGAGQYENLINPASMLRLMGAIAGGGETAEFKLIESLKYTSGITARGYNATNKDKVMNESTAEALSMMMSYNTYKTYGEDNFPGLQLCAKSGTAEVGADKEPHALFTGFITNEEHPLAFIVIIEHGGWGSSAAGSVANSVLQAAVNY